MRKQSLVMVDTEHIKQYVFGTDKLKEIRGASSILDDLNRHTMNQVAGEAEFHARPVYTNGGSGLFLLDADAIIAEKFGRRIQQQYREATVSGVSITFAVQEIPESVKDAWNEDIWESLELLNYKLVAKKNSTPDVITLPSHPFLRPCSACGIRYAEQKDKDEARDQATQKNRYCNVCWTKRREDDKVKDGIDRIIGERANTGKVTHHARNPFAWERLISLLPAKYEIPEKTERPEDFNELQRISGGKDYLAVIYADGNGMGQVMRDLRTLKERHDLAKIIDDAVYEALRIAVAQHLKVVAASGDKPPMFPFDILLVGGDDIVMVTSAAKAMDVALTIAKRFHERTKEKDPKGKGYTLSIGVVLAPVKYPFGMLEDLARETLQYAKKEGEKRQHETQYGKTLINFMTVTGATSHNFSRVYKTLHNTHVKVSGHKGDVAFYATLRPYSVEELEELLKTVRDGKKERLGRTKLHEIREAVLQMNLTTSVMEGIAVLHNWREKQREFVTKQVLYKLGKEHQKPYQDAEQPGTLFPRVTFPWFADGPDTYRTSLLDFVELYDFVEQEGADDTD